MKAIVKLLEAAFDTADLELPCVPETPEEGDYSEAFFDHFKLEVYGITVHYSLDYSFTYHITIEELYEGRFEYCEDPTSFFISSLEGLSVEDEEGQAFDLTDLEAETIENALWGAIYKQNKIQKKHGKTSY